MVKRKIVTILILSLLLFSCKKDKTYWNSQWRIPISSDTLDLRNLVHDSIIKSNLDDSYQLILKKDLLSISIDSVINFPDTTINQDVHIAVNHVDVNPGVSFINKTEEHTFNIEGAQLKELKVKTGGIDLHIESPIQGPTILTVQLPGVTKNGQMYSQTVHAPAGSPAHPTIINQHFNLQGYTIDLRGSDGTKYNIIQSKLIIKTDPNGPIIPIDNTDIIHVDVRFSGFSPSYARGYFGQHLFTDSTQIEFEKLAHITSGSISTQDVHFDVIIFNGLKVLGRARINSFKGINSQQQTVPLSYSQIGNWSVINPATGNWGTLLPSQLKWVFTDNNSNINNFIENLPYKLKLNYNLELNHLGNTNTGWDELFPDSKIRVQFKANMPLKLGANQLTYKDTLPLHVSQNYDKTHVESGEFTLHVKNAYPFDAQVSVSAIDQGGDILFTKSGLQKIKGSANLNNHQPLEIVGSTLKIQLSKEETKALNQMENLVITVKFDTPQGGQIATLYNNQFIYFQLFSNINLTTKY